ncbi:class I SAM-dependent methyltransferase [Bacillus sp. B-jedd]|uniref:class I SAM-dependent methyltransferase n=1 Tax=Bacillus sp. B-jedd TaxID=1476857 RepID=UPI0005155E06|nr:protein distantly related to SAM-dependent methyltransferase [Bacillus sp. B-jedd]CEG26209.1 Hypothetical protein BN1002_01051 [Bacillus sp. B-jedd]
MSQRADTIRIVVGAGEYMNNPGWLHTDESDLNLLDESTWKNRFDKGSVSAILAEHVWEHLTFDEGLEAARICYDYLKPSGYIRCAVPDGYFPNQYYQKLIQVGGPGPKDHPAATHKVVYNYQTLTKIFISAGFEVKLLEYFDEDGNFHENSWNGAEGVVFRSKKFDPRNKGDKLVFPSLIIDAVKP